MKNKDRIWEIDFLRGLAIIVMIFDHIMFDFAIVFKFDKGILGQISTFANTYLLIAPREYIQDFFLIVFIGLSGISSSFSRNNFLRGFKLLIVAILISVMTYFMGDDYFILFGILHMLALSIIIYAIVVRFGNVAVGTVGVLMIISGILIEYLNVSYSSNILMPFGIYNGNFFSADYYPLLPWGGIFMIGAVVGQKIYGEKKSLFKTLSNDKWHKPFEFVGRHALGFYMIHQPVIWSIIALIGLLFGFKISLF